ncbi:MAG: 50S ribosomal protein L11 methyltransferase [Ilumatobacter sp.]|uniref:50S ribosomal protein L11 methyltransferase n=1 Tax=Ilumatobacter sp. TaxID=1967498 RepID=UPI00391940C0
MPDDGLDFTDVGGDTERMIRVTVSSPVAELVSDRFWQLGVRAVSEIDLDDGRVEVSSSVGNDSDSITRAVATFDPTWSWRVDEVSTELGDDWKAFAAPVWYADDLVVVPAWRADELPASSAMSTAKREPSIVTVIEPGSAFGLGDHPTTRSTLAMLANLIRTGDHRFDAVLDVGCGTGAVAILAAQLGSPLVRAVDVAVAAVDATRHNAQLNGVETVVDVDDTAIADLDGRYDIVVANILGPVLIALAPDLVRLVADDGSLIISGILAERHQHVLEALTPLRVADRLIADGWITIRLTR